MIVLIALAQVAASQAIAPAPAVPPIATPTAPGSPSPTVLILRQDTPVELMAPTEVSTADASPGKVFKLRVNRAIEVGGRVVIPVGTPAYGEVVTASDAGSLGKSGRMTARLMNIHLGTVDIPLEGETSAKGTGAGSPAMAVVFTGLMGLFHRGNNAKIKAGEILTGFIARDTPVPNAVPLEPPGAATQPSPKVPQ